MANLGNEVRTFLLKGLESISDAAASIGNAARKKLSEMQLENRRDELRRQIPGAALQLWTDGNELPEQLSELVREFSDLDDQLSAMRAKPKAPAAEEAEAETDPATFEEAMEELENSAEEAAEAVEDWAEAKVEAVKEAVKDTLNPETEETYEPIELDDEDKND